MSLHSRIPSHISICRGTVDHKPCNEKDDKHIYEKRYKIIVGSALTETIRVVL